MVKALAITALTLAAIFYGLLIYGWAELIYKYDLGEAARVSLELWPSNVVVFILAVTGTLFLVLGLSLLGQRGNDD